MTIDMTMTISITITELYLYGNVQLFALLL